MAGSSVFRRAGCSGNSLPRGARTKMLYYLHASSAQILLSLISRTALLHQGIKAVAKRKGGKEGVEGTEKVEWEFGFLDDSKS